MIYRTSSTSDRKGIYFKNFYRGQRIGGYTPGKNAQITLCLPVGTIADTDIGSSITDTACNATHGPLSLLTLVLVYFLFMLIRKWILEVPTFFACRILTRTFICILSTYKHNIKLRYL